MISALKVEIRATKNDFSTESEVPQENGWKAPWRVIWFQIEEDPKSEQMLNNTRKIHIINKHMRMIEWVRNDSVEMKLGENSTERRQEDWVLA